MGTAASRRVTAAASASSRLTGKSFQVRSFHRGSPLPSVGMGSRPAAGRTDASISTAATRTIGRRDWWIRFRRTSHSMSTISRLSFVVSVTFQGASSVNPGGPPPIRGTARVRVGVVARLCYFSSSILAVALLVSVRTR